MQLNASKLKLQAKEKNILDAYFSLIFYPNRYNLEKIPLDYLIYKLPDVQKFKYCGVKSISNIAQAINNLIREQHK